MTEISGSEPSTDNGNSIGNKPSSPARRAKRPRVIGLCFI